MTESQSSWLAHTLPAKSDIGQGQATSPGSRLRSGLPGTLAQWRRRGEAGPSTRNPFPLTVAGPRRIHTDFRAPVPVKLCFGSYRSVVRRGNSSPEML